MSLLAPLILAPVFLLIACLYGAAGFGGGSSYLALLVLTQQPLALIPLIALICNVVVVSSNCLHHFKAQRINWRLVLLPSVFSVPMAYVGAMVPVPERSFLIVLAASLSLAGLALLWRHKRLVDEAQLRPLSPVIALGAGGSLGLLAGMVGIGGGIFLSPLLYHLRAGRAQEIAAAASFFILFNSISGILGQFSKGLDLSALAPYWPLPTAVLIGSLLGNALLYRLLPPRTIALITAGLVLFVALRLWLQIGFSI